MASSLFNLRAWQADSLFPNLSPSFLWSTSWPGTLHFILHTFLHPIIVFFSQQMPIPNDTIATCFAVVPKLCHQILASLSQLIILWLNATHPSDNSHLCPLKCCLIFLYYGTGLTSMQHTTSHTTAGQSPSHYEWYILIDKQWYQLSPPKQTK